MTWVVLLVLVILLIWVAGPLVGGGLLSAGCLASSTPSHTPLLPDAQWGQRPYPPAQPIDGFRGNDHYRGVNKNLLPGGRYYASMTRKKTGKRSKLERSLKVAASGVRPPVPGHVRFSTVVKVQEIEPRPGKKG